MAEKSTGASPNLPWGLSRDEIAQMVVDIALNFDQAPKIDARDAVALLLDALHEGYGAMSAETVGAALGALAFFMVRAADEFKIHLHPAGRA